MRHLVWPALIALAVPPAHAYIAVDASRLTLSEVMLEFPNVCKLSLEKFDSDRGAYLFTIDEALQGKGTTTKTVKFFLHKDGKVPARLIGLKKGDTAIAFLGSVAKTTLVFANGSWFVATPDKEWERFTNFRDDFNRLFAGTPTELVEAVRGLRNGTTATVPVHPLGAPAADRVYIRYEAMSPHRRWPTANPKAPKRTADEWRTLAASKAIAERQAALVALAAVPDGEALLVERLKDAHAEVRLAAVAGLSTRKDLSAAAVKALIAALKDEDRFVCAFAAYGLGRANAKDAVGALEQSLGERNWEYDWRPHRAAEAAEALLAIAPGTPSAERAVRFFLSDKMLRDQREDSEGTRTAAARALGRSGPAAKTALPELRKCLKDPVPETRIAAAEAVGRIGGNPHHRDITDVLTAELANADRTVIILAMRAAASLKATALAPALREFSSTEDATLKREAEAALRAIEKAK